jgi:hypothetical protein
MPRAGSVQFLGSGFDRIIPANNRIFWPGETTATETAAEAVSESTLTTTMPRSVVAGQIRVETRSGSAVLDFVPTLGAIEIHATTQDGTGVPGVAATLVAADGSEAASGVTDETGDLLLAALVAGSYRLDLTPPTGFALAGAASQTIEVGVGAVVSVLVSLTPLVDAISISPDNPSMVVGELIDITVVALDLNGNPITAFARSFWGAGTGHVSAGGFGLTGVVAGVYPTLTEGEARFNVALNSQLFTFSATVKSHIAGTVTKVVDGVSTPANAQEVVLAKDGTHIAKTSTDSGGKYRFDGLFAGSYEVAPVAAEGFRATPERTSVTLGQSTPIGQADFSVVDTPKPKGDIVVVNDWNIWDTGRNPDQLVQNLISTAPNSGTKVVWWCGRQANAFKICASSINTDGSGQFRGTRDAITSAGWSFEVDYQTPLASIPNDVRVFWMWTPTEALTSAEVNILKDFAARGGRIIFNADFKETWYTSTQHANIATALFTQLGTGITSTGTIRSSTGVIVAPDDPIMNGVTSVTFSAPGDMTVVSPGVPLVTDASGNVLIARAPVDVTHVALIAAPLVVAPLELPQAQIPPDCTPGEVCGGESNQDSPDPDPEWPDREWPDPEWPDEVPHP